MIRANITFRPSRWFHVRLHKERFGIEARVNGKWMPAAIDEKPAVFRSERRRDAELARLRKQETKRRAEAK